MPNPSRFDTRRPDVSGKTRSRHAWTIAALLAVVATQAALAQSPPPLPYPTGDRAAAKVMPAELAGSSPLRTRNTADSPPARQIVIERASAAAVAEALPGTAKPGVPLKTGFPREIAATRSAADTTSQLDWQVTATGRHIAALQLSSPGARGLRLGILVERLPETALLRFFAPGDAMAHEVSGSRILAIRKRNLQAGDTTDNGRTFWSPLIEGDTIALEIELPGDVPTNAVAIAIPTLSHLVKAPLESSQTLETVRIGEAGSCNLDVSCYSAWSNTANAVAKMSYVENGSTYECSGTLLADSISSSFVPYFISANHCISNQTVASTLTTYWFYRSTACNSGILNPSNALNTDGAVLLYASDSTDTSFMRLNSAPPTGAQFAAWSSATPTLGSPSTSIHHPQGDMQKISMGTLDAFSSCTVPDTSGGFSCTEATPATGNFINVTFTNGTAESGSSGSGIYTTDGSGQHYLIGTYLGGSSSCANPSGSNRYGRLDLAYTAAVRQWLSGYQISALGQAVDNSSLNWTTGGNSTFFSQSTVANYGGSALQSGSIGNSQSVFLSAPVTGPGTLSFFWKVSSELNYDFLNVYVDDALQSRISGEVGWTKASVAIPEGSHAVKWSYTKDNLAKAGLDAGWIDRVELAAAAVTPTSGLWSINAEVNGQPGRGFTIEVQHGVLVLTIFGYDAAGGDAFYQAAGNYSGGTFSGTLNYYSGGTTFGGAFKSASLAGSAGTVTMTFTDSTHGTITLPGESAKAFSKFNW
jgi:hypothetical protein